MNFRIVSRWLLVAVLTLSLAAVCQACPTCKNGIADGPQQAGMVRGYFWSILFMMSMPFVIFGSLGTYFYLEVRRARTAQAAAAELTAAATSSATSA